MLEFEVPVYALQPSSMDHVIKTFILYLLYKNQTLIPLLLRPFKVKYVEQTHILLRRLTAYASK